MKVIDDTCAYCNIEFMGRNWQEAICMLNEKIKELYNIQSKQSKDIKELKNGK